MTERRELRPDAPWTQITATEADWDAADGDLLQAMFAQLILIRAFEQYVLDLSTDGLINGPAHSSIGQEGGAVGSVLALIEPGHRQRLSPWPPPVPRKDACPCRAEGHRSAAAVLRRRAHGSHADARRDLRSGSWLEPRPRWLDASAVEAGRCDRHERDRRGRGAACRRIGVGTPPRRHQRCRGDVLR